MIVINLKISESGNTSGKEASEGTTDVSHYKERVTTKGAHPTVF